MLNSIVLNDVFPAYLSFLFSPAALKLFVTILVVGVAVKVAIAVLRIYIAISKRYTLLEIRPSYKSLKSALSTTELFTIIHGALRPSRFLEKATKAKQLISFEIASTRNEGIRYIVRIPSEKIIVLKKTLIAYSPDTEVRDIGDYLPQSPEKIIAKEFTLSNDFVYPIKSHDALKEHDPIAYLTNHMTKLLPQEMVSLQIAASPVTGSTHASINRHIRVVKKMITENKDITKYTHAYTITKFVEAVMGAKRKKITELSKFMQLQHSAIEHKIRQPLFETSIRVFVQSDKNALDRLNGITSSFNTFADSSQSLQPVQKYIAQKRISNLGYYLYKKRVLSLFHRPVLSVSELASIYHYPYTATAKTEDVVKTRPSQLPIPLRFKNTNTNYDIVFASNTYGGVTTPIGMTLDERRRHMYIIGATGTGKTTLLLKMIHEDIKNGKGVAVLDPHGDLAERLIGVIPPSRHNDVVYFNPHDVQQPIGLNILEKSQGLSLADESLENDLITSGLVSVFHKLYPARYSGPRMEHVLRNAVLTALEEKNPTLLSVYKLLTNVSYRRQAVEKLTDPILKDFWKDEFEKQGSYQKAELISPITNKLGRFLTTTMTRNILTQEQSKLKFDDIMNNKKILICDLSKGKIGEDTSAFLGSLITVKLQLAALKRVHVPEVRRTDFYLYIDEFQNFASMAFAQIMSEARKYRLNTILSHQTISQIEDKDLLKIILANVGTVIAFRTNNPSDESIMLPLFSPEVEKNEISNLPSFTFYAKMNAITPQETFTGISKNFSVSADAAIRKLIIEHSQKKYGSVPNKLSNVMDKTSSNRSERTIIRKRNPIKITRKSI